MNRIVRIISAMVLALVPLTMSCGGGSGNSGPSKGPNAVLNGSSLNSATSHWVAGNCPVQVEIATDGGFYSVVRDSSGTTSSGGGTWAPSGTDGLSTAGWPDGLQGFFWVASLNNISGSTSSGTFTAATTVQTDGTPQALGSCTFSLQQGQIPGS